MQWEKKSIETQYDDDDADVVFTALEWFINSILIVVII